MLWRKQEPLLHCQVRHELPGRVRICCRALGFLHDHALEIAAQERAFDKSGRKLRDRTEEKNTWIELEALAK